MTMNDPAEILHRLELAEEAYPDASERPQILKDALELRGYMEAALATNRALSDQLEAAHAQEQSAHALVAVAVEAFGPKRMPRENIPALIVCRFCDEGAGSQSRGRWKEGEEPNHRTACYYVEILASLPASATERMEREKAIRDLLGKLSGAAKTPLDDMDRHQAWPPGEERAHDHTPYYRLRTLIGEADAALAAEPELTKGDER